MKISGPTHIQLTRMLIFFLNIKEQQLFKLADLKYYCSPKLIDPLSN